jgi:hypothetical protein
LKDIDGRFDPPNMKFWHEGNLAALDDLENGNSNFSLLKYTLDTYHVDLMKKIRFIAEDKSYIINGVEHAIHGHLGANGSAGSPSQYAKMGAKITTAHAHSPAIRDGVYRAGTSSKLDLGYNKGPSSWSPSHVVQTLNGKRTIITLMNGRWKEGHY